MSESIEPYQRRSRRLTRQQQEAFQVAETRAELQARQDEIAAQRAATHVANVTRLTRHGLAGASLVAAEAETAVQMSPWAAQQIASVAEAGISGIRGAIVQYAIEKK